MLLVAGTRLGPYVIEAPLGTGGMGEVYKARDTRLGRIVAVKILPSADPELKQRFERETKVIAALTHPHICTVYDVGHQDGHDYLVMEVLDGETLANRIARGPLPRDEALQHAVTIADALDAAHRAGIIHRDLKPANIMLATRGPKLLDFGIAKQLPSGRPGMLHAVSTSATQTTPLTQRGTVLGTVQYMAPEVMEGAEADTRSDIWSFGAILHEMLSGRKAFEANSTAALIAAVLEHDPGPLDPATPPSVVHVLTRCLAKNPDERWQTARDLLHELKWVAGREGGVAPADDATPSGTRARIFKSSAFAGLCGLVIGGLIVGFAARARWTGSGVPNAVTRSLVGVAPADQLQSNPIDLTSGEGRPSQVAMALSPDGRAVAFSAIRQGRQQLFLRQLDQLEATPLDDTVDAANPFFSSDGKWIGFWAAGALRKVSVTGGPATKICDSVRIFGASWGSNDMIVFGTSVLKGIMQVAASGGTPTAVTKLDTAAGELGHRLPQFLPGNREILFTVVSHFLPDWSNTDIVVQSLTSGQRKTLTKGADARYLPTGHLMFVRSGSVLAVRFDAQRLETVGGSVTLLTDVMQAANSTTAPIDSGAGQLSVSSSGSLLYLSGSIHPDAERTIAWVDRLGAVQPLPLPSRAYLAPRLSPDGRQILVWTQGADRAVWTYDLERGTLKRISTEARSSRALWTPDGRHVTFAASTAGPDNIFSRAADGSGPTERLTTSDTVQMPASWSPDGKALLFTESLPGTGGSGRLHIREANGEVRALHETRAIEKEPDFSPDGRWIAYVSDESGRDEVYVRAYPGGGPSRPVSNGGGRVPGWSRDGHELFYLVLKDLAPGGLTPTQMMSVSVTTENGFTAGLPRLLFDGQFTMQTMVRGWDVAPGGNRFLMVVGKERPALRANQMILVQNWFDELRRRVPTQ